MQVKKVSKDSVKLCETTQVKLKTAGNNEYSCAAEPLVRCGESHPSGLTEPPYFDIYCA